MKKYFAGLLCSAICFAGCSAQDSSDACDAASSYAGWFVGGGLGYQYTKADAVYDDNTHTMDDDVGTRDIYHESLQKVRNGRLGASLVGGYGRYVTGHCYLGGELTLDIAGNRTKKGMAIEDRGFMSTKVRGFVPTVALRLGGYVPAVDSLIYLRGGFTFLETKHNSKSTKFVNVKSKSITPVLGLGIEKSVYGKFTVRAEWDYRFGADKSKTNLQVYDNDGVAVDDATCHIKNQTRGHAVRLMAVYHF